MPRRDPTRRSTRVPRLLERVIQQRRVPESGPEPAPAVGDLEPNDEGGIERRLQTLEARLEYLETLVEGLQDSVHRESVRHQKQIDTLQRGQTW
jgi:hypothetical protein